MASDTNGLVSFLQSLGQQADDNKTAKNLQDYTAASLYNQTPAPQQPGVLSQLLKSPAAAVAPAFAGIPGVGGTLSAMLNGFGGGSSQNTTDPSQQPPGQTVPAVSTAQAVPQTQQPQANADASQPVTLNSNLAGVLANREKAYGLPSGYLAQTAMIESGGNPNVGASSTGAKGLFQFTNGTAKQYGLTDPSNPMQSADAAGRLAADNATALTQALGRAPTAGELYLAHQQGAAGAAALIKNPNAPAGQVLASIGADPNNIAVNGGDPNAPAGAFVGKWASRFDTGGSAQPSSAVAYAGAQPQAPAQAAISAATGQNAPNPSSFKGFAAGLGQAQIADNNSSDDDNAQPTTGRSASPGQAAPQQAAPAPVALPAGAAGGSKLPPQAALNALLADPNTRAYGVEILKAYQAKQLGPSYTMTQVPGLGWVNINHDTGQASLLKGDDVKSPAAFQQQLDLAKAQKEQADKFSVVKTGEDQYGNASYSVLNQSTGQYTPVNAPAAQTTQQPSSDLHGADYLATLDPGISGQVKAIVEGRAAYPTGALLKSPIGQRLATYVQQTDPTFDASNSGARSTMVKNLSLATPSSLGGQINTGNTAIGHLADLSNAVADLDNVDFGITGLTHAANTVRGWSTDQAAKINALQDAAQHYGQEITKFYAGSPGGEQERQSFLSKLDAAKSPQELAGVIQTEAELMPARLNSIDAQIQGTLGPGLASKYPVIRPESQKALATINANLARLKGIAPASGNASPAGAPSQSDLEAEARRRGLIK